MASFPVPDLTLAGSLQQYVSDSYLYRAQLFEGRLALTWTYMLKSLFLFLQFKSIFSDNFLYSF